MTTPNKPRSEKFFDLYPFGGLGIGKGYTLLWLVPAILIACLAAFL